MSDYPIDRNLIDHSSLVSLLPYVHSYCEKGLRSIVEGQDCVPVSAIETYSTGVFSRVHELDTGLVSLRLACRFISELGTEHSPNPIIYRYHYENFVLRVIGIVDRAHRLVGAALLLPPKKYEGMGGNRFVQNATRANRPRVYEALKSVMSAVDSYRGPRNELIHSSAYSSRELGIFMGIEHIELDTGSVDINELKRDYSSSGAAEIEQTIMHLLSTLEALLGELGTVFSTAHHVSVAKKVDGVCPGL